MKTPLLHPVFVAAFGLATLNQCVEKGFGIFIPFVHSYLDDVLCFPIVLTVGLAAYRLADKNYTLTKWHIWPLFLIFIIVFEVYMPTQSARYTADFFDILAYALGIFIFEKSINKSNKISLAINS